MRTELMRRKENLHRQIRELTAEKNRLELELSTLKTEYSAIDRELAEMNICYCRPGESGRSRKKVTFTLEQIHELARKLGVTLDSNDDEDD